MTPTFVIGGDWIAWISAARSRFRPSRQAPSRIVESRMCSRLWIGSASIPSRPSRLVTVVLTRSASSSRSSISAASGAANDDRIEIGSPAVLPGV